MNNRRITSLIFALIMTASVSVAQTVDWQAVEKIRPYSRLSVKIRHRTSCYFEKATDDKLFCDSIPWGPFSTPSDRAKLVFERKEVREVKPEADDGTRWLSLILGAQGGGGLDAWHQPTAFGGVKLGMAPVTVDLGYDRIQRRSGFSTEVSGILPLFRVPGPQLDQTKKFLRVYGEPGIGYRTGGGAFGGYTSAKVLLVYFPNDSWYNNAAYPYIEFQRRFPFNSPLRGDNRLAIGIMVALCEHCGFD